MKIIITVEDTGSDMMKVVANPSVETLVKMRKDKKETPATECALFALLKIHDAIKNSKKSKGIIIPPYVRAN